VKRIPLYPLEGNRLDISQQVIDYLVARAGVQPATFALGVRCSMQLSYRATNASVSRGLAHPAVINLVVESLCLRFSVDVQ
jgi:hypothetical protein